MAKQTALKAIDRGLGELGAHRDAAVREGAQHVDALEPALIERRYVLDAGELRVGRRLGSRCEIRCEGVAVCEKKSKRKKEVQELDDLMRPLRIAITVD